MYVAYVDASCDCLNDNQSTIGYIIKKDESIIYSHSKPVGSMDSMKAEWLAMSETVKKIIELNLPHITIHTDCKSIVNQLYNPNPNVKEKYYEYYINVMTIMNLHRNITVKWIKREKNIRADQLSRKGKNKEIIKVNNIKLNNIHSKQNRKYLKGHRHTFFRCPTCKELKFYRSFPHKRSKHKRECFHCATRIII